MYKENTICQEMRWSNGKSMTVKLLKYLTLTLNYIHARVGDFSSRKYTELKQFYKKSWLFLYY